MRVSQPTPEWPEWVAHLSHEIRTPLSGILGMQSLALSAPLGEEQREFIEAAQQSAEHLLQLVDQILDYSRIEARHVTLDRELFSPLQLLKDCARQLSASALEKGLAVEVATAALQPVFVRGDPLRLRQVILNLLGNAIKFTDTGGVRLAVESAGQDQGEVVLRYTVADTGIGIPAGQQERIFQPFRQVERPAGQGYGGAGLGLTISARLIELMGGRIRVESAPGQGSTVSFTVRAAGQ